MWCWINLQVIYHLPNPRSEPPAAHRRAVSSLPAGAAHTCSISSCYYATSGVYGLKWRCHPRFTASPSARTTTTIICALPQHATSWCTERRLIAASAGSNNIASFHNRELGLQQPQPCWTIKLLSAMLAANLITSAGRWACNIAFAADSELAILLCSRARLPAMGLRYVSK